MSESKLHSSIKELYSKQGGQEEVLIDGYLIDVVLNEELIEIQTHNFSALKNKLQQLLKNHRVCLVHPIPQEKWIVRVSTNEERVIGRRKSPKHGQIEDLFYELVSFPQLALHTNFTLEVLLTREEEYWQKDGAGSWRRKGWHIINRSLLDVIKNKNLKSRQDYIDLLPPTLPQPYTTLQLSSALDIRRKLAQKMAFCLRSMGIIEIVGKKGNAFLYTHSHKN
jgi:hypothetical protein